MSVISITKENFEETVMKSKKPVLIDFFATWCGPCMMVSPIVDEIAEETDSAVICKVDVDDNPELANAFGVSLIPTLAVIRNGKVVSKVEGFMNKEQILAMLK